MSNVKLVGGQKHIQEDLAKPNIFFVFRYHNNASKDGTRLQILNLAANIPLSQNIKKELEFQHK